MKSCRWGVKEVVIVHVSHLRMVRGELSALFGYSNFIDVTRVSILQMLVFIFRFINNFIKIIKGQLLNKETHGLTHGLKTKQICEMRNVL